MPENVSTLVRNGALDSRFLELKKRCGGEEGRRGGG